MVGGCQGDIGIFPGRFQPFTNAHLNRIIKIREAYHSMPLYILVGDVGSINHENFLLAQERCEIITSSVRARDISGVYVRSVPAAYPSAVWVRNIKQVVPGATTVFSDNPFVYEPLERVGYTAVIHKREGIDSSSLRNLPFTAWKQLIPSEAYAYIKEHKLYKRLSELSPSGRYPFMGNA